MLVAGTLLATAAQALRAGDAEPPLKLRRLLIRSGLGGITALVIGSLLIAKFTISPWYVLGICGVVGYAGGDVLGWIAGAFKSLLDAYVAGKGGGPKP